MRAVVTRVHHASVTIDGKINGQIRTRVQAFVESIEIKKIQKEEA